MLEILLEILLTLFLLFIGAELLVRSSISYALSLGITPFWIGLTLIGYATSFPEFVVSINAAIQGHPELAVGNVVGSNLFNITLVIGISLLIRPMGASEKMRRFDLPFMGFVALLLAVGAYIGSFSRFFGFLFLLLLILYSLISYRLEKRDRKPEDKMQAKWKPVKSLTYLFLSLALILVSSHFFVDGSVKLARRLDISDGLIGLTLVAIGTSLPELATAIVASLKKHDEIVLGNVVGSNIYNVLAIIGIMAIIQPITVAHISPFAYGSMLFVNLFLTFLFYTKKRIGLPFGLFFILIYFIYIGYDLFLIK